MWPALTLVLSLVRVRWQFGERAVGLTREPRPVPYSDAVQEIQPDEPAHIRRCIESLLRTNEMTFDRHRHGYRATHAKSHERPPGQPVAGA